MTTVADVIARLDARVPFRWADEWDRVGLLAGDERAPVERIYVTLDPTPSALDRALRGGADVLLTHHPAFLEPLRSVTGGDTDGSRVVFEAVRAGVALIACHTNLDRSPEGSDRLPALLGLEAVGELEFSDVPGRPRMGRVCAVPEGTTLATLAKAVGGVLNTPARYWGDAERSICRVAVAQGSGGALVEASRAAGCDVLLTGELRYHASLEVLESGLAVIEAGHDATEWPLVALLGEMVADVPGLAFDSVIVDTPARRWQMA